MKKMVGVFKGECRKFLNPKILLVFICAVILFAIITAPIFEQVFTFDYSDEYNEIKIKNLESDYLRSKENYENNTANFQEYLIYKYHEYRYLNNVLTDNENGSTRDRGSYLRFSNFFVVGIYILVLIYGGLILTREYGSKNILNMATAPIKRRYFYLSKLVIINIYAIVGVTLFYIITGIISLKYSGTGLVILFLEKNSFTASPVAMNYVQLAFALFGMSVVSAMMMGAVSIFMSALIKNAYVSIPLTILIILALTYLTMTDYRFAFLPFDTLLPNLHIYQVLGQGKSDSAINNFLASLLTVILATILGAYVFEKRQVKE